MDDLRQKVNAILEDPSRMQQLMDLASGMGLPVPDNRQALNHSLQHIEEKEHRQELLVKALLPYLNPARRSRLERAMQLSHLSRLAGMAIANLPDAQTAEKEEKADV